MSQSAQNQTPFTSGPVSGPYAVAPAPMGSGQYEFGDAENAVIGAVGGRATAWGTVSLIVGVFQVLVALATLRTPGTAIVQLVSGMVSIIVGVRFRGVGLSFGRVVTTRGDDVGHLLAALRSLDGALKTQLAAALAGFLVVVLAVVAIIALRM